jgi:hypothetical protein
MEDFDEDPLGLLDDDGDGVNEMCLLFDEDDEKKKSSGRPPSNSGCCVVLLCIGASMLIAGWGDVN